MVMSVELERGRRWGWEGPVSLLRTELGIQFSHAQVGSPPSPTSLTGLFPASASPATPLEIQSVSVTDIGPSIGFVVAPAPKPVGKVLSLSLRGRMTRVGSLHFVLN